MAKSNSQGGQATPRQVTADTRLPTLAMVGPQEANNVLGRTNYIGMDNPADSKGKSPTNTGKPVESTFVADTGGIRDAENGLIWDGADQVSQFEAFKKSIIDDESWIFLVGDPSDMQTHGPRGYAQTNGWYQDPNPEQTKQTINGEHALLRAVGDSIWSIGHFAAELNNAAQLYALADENSTVPQETTF